MELFGFGISGGELVVLLLIILVVMGPKHMSEGVHTLSKAIATLRQWSRKTREQTTLDALGFSLEDLKALDPRQYDPRALIREAVQEEMKAWTRQMELKGPIITNNAQTASFSQSSAAGNIPGSNQPSSDQVRSEQYQQMLQWRRKKRAAQEFSPSVATESPMLPLGQTNTATPSSATETSTDTVES